MDNVRVFLWLTLLGMAWLTYTAWQADYSRPPRGSVTDTLPPAQPGQPASTLPPLDPAGEPPAETPAAGQPAAPTGELVRVRTDVLDVAIASLGGDLVRADLLQYPVSKDVPEPVVRLLNESGPERWVFQTGL